MKIVTTRGSLLSSRTPSVAPISGSAGSMMSIDIAVIDINSAINAMNSRNWSGNRVTVGFVFKLALMQAGHARSCREDAIVHCQRVHRTTNPVGWGNESNFPRQNRFTTDPPLADVCTTLCSWIVPAAAKGDGVETA